jgi:hypothetical protein
MGLGSLTMSKGFYCGNGLAMHKKRMPQRYCWLLLVLKKIHHPFPSK